METVGQRIQHVRTQRSLTLDQLAAKAGISKSFLWGVEHDKTGISSDKLVQIASVLGASLDFLMTGERATQNNPSPTIEIPQELGELAEDLGLTYQDTKTLLDIAGTFVARRSTGTRTRKTKEEWKQLYDGVRPWLDNGK